MYKATTLELLDDDRLAKIAADPNCSNSKECLELLAKRQTKLAKRAEEEQTTATRKGRSEYLHEYSLLT
jgi:hypothetical protein